jgi:hypothetical protein
MPDLAHALPPPVADHRSDAAAATLAARITRQLVSVIEARPLATDPFDHLVLQQPLPPRDYPALLAALPPDRYYRELRHSDALLPDGHSARLQFPLLPANIARLPPPTRATWRAVAQAAAAPAVIEALRGRFAAALSQASGKPATQLRLRPYLTLFRDLGGYRIAIHPDSPRKAITLQFYLPADDAQLHLGTLFHRRDPAGDAARDAVGGASEGDGGYALVQAMRFAPNSGYAFAVTPSSFHSVAPMRTDDRPRNSLMLIVSHDRGPLVEGFKRARAWLRAGYDRVRGRDAAVESGEGRYESM